MSAFPPRADTGAASVARGVIAFYRMTFWAAPVFSFVMAILPRPPQLPGDSSDKSAAHYAFDLARLGSGSYRSMPPIRLLASLPGFAG